MHKRSIALPYPANSCLTSVPACEGLAKLLTEALARFKVGAKILGVTPGEKLYTVLYEYADDDENAAVESLLVATRELSATVQVGGMATTMTAKVAEVAKAKGGLAELAAAIKPAQAPAENREAWPLKPKAAPAPTYENMPLEEQDTP